jgi:hypothetical protein
MSALINWIDDRKKSTNVLVVFLVLTHASAFLFSNVSWIALIAVIASIVCPFAIFLVWVVDSPWIDKLLGRRWTSALIVGTIVVYGMFANTFASDLINGLFKVDPTHFTVTSIFLTTVYLLVGVFQPFVMFPVWLTFLLLAGVLIPLLLLMGSNKQAFKHVGFVLLAIWLVSASTQSLGLLKYHLPLLAERVALASDFNENYRCTAKWDVQVDKVVFLNDGHVLAHVQGTRKYEILPCEPR